MGKGLFYRETQGHDADQASSLWKMDASAAYILRYRINVTRCDNAKR